MAENQESLLARLAKEIANALRPLAGDGEPIAPGELPEFFALLLEGAGIELAEALGDDALEAITGALTEISAVLGNLLSILDSEELPTLGETDTLIKGIGRAIDALNRLNGLDLKAVDAGDVAASVGDLGTLLLEYLLATYLLDYHPRIYNLLMAAGIVRIGRPGATKLANRLQRVYFDRIGEFLRDAKSYPQTAYGWGTAGFRPHELLTPLAFLLRTLGLPAMVADPAQDVAALVGWNPSRARDLEVRLPLVRDETEAAQAGLAMLPMRSATGAPLGLAIIPYGVGSVSEKRDAGDNWELSIAASGSVKVRYGVLISFEKLDVGPLDGSQLPADYEFRLWAGLARKAAPGARIFLFGEGDTVVVDAGRLGVALGATVANNEGDFAVELALEDGQLRVSKGKGDGFLQKLLPEKGIASPFAVTVGVSRALGLYFRGSAGLAVTLAIHKDILGVLKIETVDLAVQVGGTQQGAQVELMAAVSAGLKLGPFSASVERVGVRALMTFPKSGGNLGPVNLLPAFKPPDGAGMALKAKAITGGGYLFFDHKNGQYAGVLQLSVKDKIGLTVIGLLTTRLPDGRKGFSLLLIITANFPPIQLGYGFVLTGVGGLIGVHRTMVVDALRAGVQSGGLNAILFPQNPVENAPKIISDLKSFFPPAEGRFTFGPMAQIGWGGAYPLLTIELGILIELPSPVRVALLGRVTLALPKREQPGDPVIVYLRMDILGVIDFEKSDLSIDATLFDSRIATFPIAGDMALRFNWGASPAFALSAGGFHPGYTPPPAFPALRRLSISLAEGDNPRVRAESYLAVTTAAAMFGARLEVYAERAFGPLGTFSVQGHLGFDALARFKPFSFIVEMGADATLRRNGAVIFAVTISLTLTGPQPLAMHGFARFEFLGKHEIPVAATIGDSPPAENATTFARPIDELVAEIEKPSNWSAQLPPAGQATVTLREVERPADGILAHPLGRLTFRQQVVPLRTAISRYGEAQVEGPTWFDLTMEIGGANAVPSDGLVYDSFAPSMFSEQSDDAKLGGPAFVALPSGYAGIGLDVDDAEWGDPQSRVFGYEDTVIDNVEEQQKTRSEERYLMTAEALAGASRLSAAARSTIRATGDAAFAGPADQRVALAEPRYVVANVDTLAKVGPADSHYGAKVAQGKQAEPARWQVVGRHEAH